MKIQDLLRNLLDLVDGKELPEIEQETQTTDGIMLPPLQQNLELMKRAVDVPNIFGDVGSCDCAGCQSGDECCADSESEDELDRIRTIAGVPTAAIITLSNDQSFPSQG